MAVCSICSETFLTSLTPRECQILALLAEALSARLIGEKLYISDKTVYTYYTRMCKKLHLSNRDQLMCYAVRHMMQHEGGEGCQKIPA